MERDTGLALNEENDYRVSNWVHRNLNLDESGVRKKRM